MSADETDETSGHTLRLEPFHPQPNKTQTLPSSCRPHGFLIRAQSVASPRTGAFSTQICSKPLPFAWERVKRSLGPFPCHLGTTWAVCVLFHWYKLF
ncbi:hypothetical protein AAFF_G00429110 [Aldrovandia affinis]|uniref:Uncharacterized protein n=1 Tax=Aldrovandia affinis TaxID=143900 RepID=A0AAD7S960_9TELE|nr:hypothetical protein AAFF_G00429110 [Aldrovandia affinis]